ncbi:hypothetical protein CPB86DRAFT_182174 [Serendipita vermifera]|nr:hypothetical protein CPB86DRAFT_182174 [Serendipita vermifera]
MALDLGVRDTTILLQETLNNLKKRRMSSRLVLSSCPGPSAKAQVIQHLTSTSFSSHITYLRLHAPDVLLHLQSAFLLPPPPLSTEAKFYNIFSPFTSRERREGEELAFGSKSRPDIPREETVVEIVHRSASSRKGVERSLEGWIDHKGPSSLQDLSSLKECFANRSNTQEPDSSKSTGEKATTTGTAPAMDLPFNLNLTAEQQASRAAVPLPYAHTGDVPHQHSTTTLGPGPANSAVSGGSAIYYDPDSADDMDDEDPDEDLDL